MVEERRSIRVTTLFVRERVVEDATIQHAVNHVYQLLVLREENLIEYEAKIARRAAYCQLGQTRNAEASPFVPITRVASTSSTEQQPWSEPLRR